MPAPAIGIDLGTTFSVVAFVDKGGAVEILQNTTGSRLTPSVVNFNPEIVLVGLEAVKARSHSQNKTIYDIKRIMGRKHDDEEIHRRAWPFEILRDRENNRAVIRVETKKYSPEQISALILKYMKDFATKFFGEEVKNAVITVPSNFTNAQRQATKNAGKMAGLNVLQIVNEPTAAALAFCGLENLRRKDGLRVLVYDLGGGTFDVSIVEYEGKKTKVLATGGHTNLGGTDFDAKIYEDAVCRYKELGINIGPHDWIIRDACEKAKKTLANNKTVQIMHPNYRKGFHLTREAFEDICMDLFESTITHTEKVLADAKIDEGSLDEILLVGGSTRIIYIRKLLKDRFPSIKIRDDVEPDFAVARGAALLASSLSSNPKSTTLADVIPMSLRMRVGANDTKLLIPKNTRVPFASLEYLSNPYAEQTKLIIEILEGEEEKADKNNSLGTLEFEVPPKPVGKNCLEVILSIDKNGILSVSAKDVYTDQEASCVFESDMLDSPDLKRMIDEVKNIAVSG